MLCKLTFQQIAQYKKPQSLQGGLAKELRLDYFTLTKTVSNLLFLFR